MDGASIVGWAITLVLCAAIVAFFVHLAGLARLPHSRRPPVPKFDRFGRPLGDDENEAPSLDQPDGSPASRGRIPHGKGRRHRARG